MSLDFPFMLYRGDRQLVVQNADEKARALEAGWSVEVPRADLAPEVAPQAQPASVEADPAPVTPSIASSAAPLPNKRGRKPKAQPVPE